MFRETCFCSYKDYKYICCCFLKTDDYVISPCFCISDKLCVTPVMCCFEEQSSAKYCFSPCVCSYNMGDTDNCMCLPCFGCGEYKGNRCCILPGIIAYDNICILPGICWRDSYNKYDAVSLCFYLQERENTKRCWFPCGYYYKNGNYTRCTSLCGCYTSGQQEVRPVPVINNEPPLRQSIIVEPPLRQNIIVEQKIPERKFIEETCVICLTTKSTFGFYPCGHVCLCTDCRNSKYFETCPMCKATNVNIFKN